MEWVTITFWGFSSYSVTLRPYGYFLWTRWTTCFTNFLTTTRMSIFYTVEAHSEFLFKMDSKLFSSVFGGTPPCNQVAKSVPRVEGHRSKKEVIFVHRIFFFKYLPILFLIMVWHDALFNVTAVIWMWSFPFFQIFFQVLQCWSFEPRSLAWHHLC